MSTPPLPPTCTTLLSEAHTAARQQAKQWIRSVFQEVHGALWRDQWKVEDISCDNNNDDSKTTRIHITEDMMVASQRICRRVALQWCQRVEAQGHFEFAKWIRDVLEKEQDTFFVADNDNDEDDEQNVEEQETQTVMDQEEESTLKEAPPSPSVAEQQQDEQQEGETNVPVQPQHDPSFPLFLNPLGALNKLQLPQLGDEQQVIDEIDAMGIADKTYWPFDWDMIQESAQNIPTLMYKHNPNNKLNLKLVPKNTTTDTSTNTADTTTTDTNENEPDNPTMPPPQPGATAVSSTEQTIIAQQRKGYHFVAFQRKRAAAQAKASDAHNSNKRPKLTTLLPDDEPRLPTLFEQVDIPWNEQVAQQMKDTYPELDHLVHSPTTDDNAATLLLGALKPLGHVHNAIQVNVESPDWEHFSERKQRRKFIVAVRERLGQNQFEKVPKPHRVQSKIRRTIQLLEQQHTDNDNSKTRDCVDFDMGECLLDLQQHDDGDRRALYAFSSLEVCLLDEDAEHAHNNQRGE
ncbi:expressed unknown protein [Seminavis robusta]|uniref:Uncharacterized protein n=1 Tax=Seminavis robusta TaxID=568900 RepID=A0A9N8DRE7_9STRA|nr:expressed unknown protein [Seminavis robusta]|eukprot:Sro235_g094630.1 n/a (518) ;mRNA; r:9763-11316